MIKDILSGSKAAVQERLTNPLVGAFLIAWLFWNWEIIVVILKSDLPIEKVIVDSVSPRLSLLSGFLVPFVVALGFTLALPWVGYLTALYGNFVDIRRRRVMVAHQIKILEMRKGIYRKQAELDEIRKQAE